MANNVSKTALHTTGTFPKQAIQNHHLRINSIIEILIEHEATKILDIGCGDGVLLEGVSNSELVFTDYTGLDNWSERIDAAQKKYADNSLAKFVDGDMLDIRQTEINPTGFSQHSAAVMLEVIEHISLEDVPMLEENVFGYLKPQIIIVTTPDASIRLNEQQMKARGHLFEWDKTELKEWSEKVAKKFHYSYNIQQLSGPTFVRNTQIATFEKLI